MYFNGIINSLSVIPKNISLSGSRFSTDNMYSTLGKLYNFYGLQFLPLQNDKEFRAKYIVTKIAPFFFF